MSEMMGLIRRLSRPKHDSDAASDTPIDTPTSEPEVVAEGMQCGFKELWSGPEDKYGKFKWLDTKPDDLGKPAEDSESAKWALIVRHVRVHNDPRKVLRIHSILVQSPLLKALLGKVLQGYPGVTTTLQRLTFSGRFEPLIHRWTELKKGVEDEEVATTKEHAALLLSVLQEEFSEIIDESTDMKKNGVITFPLLWTQFQPDSLVYSRIDEQDRVLKLKSTMYAEDRDGNQLFVASCQYVDYDGTRFGTSKIDLQIEGFTGTTEIARLKAFPFDLHPNHDAIREKLVERGAKFEALAGIHYKHYKGIGWNMIPRVGIDRRDCDERIVIDAGAYNKNNPNLATYVSAFHATDTRRIRNRRVVIIHDGGSRSPCETDDDSPPPSSAGSIAFNIDLDASGMPYEGYASSDEANKKSKPKTPLTDDQKLLASPVVRGYALTSKAWLNFFVNNVKEISFNEDAFASLVLPENQKELILGFTETQNANSDTFDDVIQGKGRGIILLLCGPPGVGKTLTAESVSEQMRVPLFAMSAGDLGLDPRNVERALTATLDMCAAWRAVCLIDEADIFLEQRSLHELERNKLVTIFLRVLEYYRGIMFLTTNRVQTFDPAFQSRIHISLDYPELNAASRLTVWRNFLDRVHKSTTPEDADADAPPRPDHDMTPAEIGKLAELELNGRQIKNTIKTSRLLAQRRGARLGYEHVRSVLGVTQHWLNTTRETDRERRNIYS